MTARRYVHAFDAEVDDPAILGGKGASIARMRALGIPSPPGFTIGTDGWRAYVQNERRLPDRIMAEVDSALEELQAELGRRFGDASDPLLVSVRSGAPVSMPGMMDTVLNLGMNDASAVGICERRGDAFGWVLYRRLLSQFATVVRGLDAAAVDAAAVGAAAEAGEDRAACAALLEAIASGSGAEFPQRPEAQLREAIEAVWRSWDGRRARRYRRYSGISDELGTAVTVQAMAFGNYDERSGTGVVFTRDPATGTPGAYGDYLACAQGEDVVAGTHQTEPLEVMRARLPEAYEELERALPKLEAAYRDMCDVEFTVESGKLWILQARIGQRSGAAAIRIAVDLVDEGLIGVEEALARVPVSALHQLQAPVLAENQQLDLLGAGTPAAPGAATGAAAFDAERAQAMAEDGRRVILVRPETSPEDIAGMIAAAGIVTAIGGRTSHAAVVARGLGRPAVCGVAELGVDPGSGEASFGDRHVAEGEMLTIDGAKGIVAAGEARLVPAQPEPRAAQLLSWCEARQSVEIAATAPERYVPAAGAEEARGEAVLLELEWDGPRTQERLNRLVEAALDNGARELALRLPEGISDGDLVPPPAPWMLLVGPAESWPARLLATRMASSSQPARG